MSFSFNSQINKEKNTTKYSIQIETDNKEQYLFMQEMARECIDGKHKEKKCNAETFAEHYGCQPLTWGDIKLPEGLTHSPIPNCCKNCPNHPSNGGSGICNCIAPYIEQGNSITCTTTSHNIIGDQK